MPVITLSRQMGSRGDDVAQAVAHRLGLRLIGRDFINRAAIAAGAPEIALAEIDELGLLGIKPSAAARRLYQHKVAEVILALAAAGDVLLAGRGGQAVLAGQPGVLHVRIIAPRPQRVATVQERCQITPEAAAARVQASDQARTAYLRRHYGLALNDPALYDLVLNLARLDVDAAAAIICLAASRLAGAGPQPAGSAGNTGGAA